MCWELDTLFPHHKIPLSWGGSSDKENIIALCENCHKKTHKELNKRLNVIIKNKILSQHKEEILDLIGDMYIKNEHLVN